MAVREFFFANQFTIDVRWLLETNKREKRIDKRYVNTVTYSRYMSLKVL